MSNYSQNQHQVHINKQNSNPNKNALLLQKSLINNTKTTTSNISNIPSSFDFKLGSRKDFQSNSYTNNNSFAQQNNKNKNVFCHRSKQSKDSISEVIKDMEGIKNNLNLNMYIPKDLHYQKVVKNRNKIFQGQDQYQQFLEDSTINFNNPINLIHDDNTNRYALQQLQQSQEELSFLKYKLTEAYQKLQKEILNSYQLQEKVQNLIEEVNQKRLIQQMLNMEKKENEQLRHTMTAILNNRRLLEEQNEKIKKDTKKLQTEYKEISLKIEQQKVLFKKIKDQLTEKNNSFRIQIEKYELKLRQQKQDKQKLYKDCQKLTNLGFKAKIDQLSTQNKKLLLKQSHYLNKINILESQLRKVTDQKVTTVNRLKHEIALYQQSSQNNSNIVQYQQVQERQVYNNNLECFNNITYSPMVNKRSLGKSCSKMTITPNANRNFDDQNQIFRVVTYQNGQKFIQKQQQVFDTRSIKLDQNNNSMNISYCYVNNNQKSESKQTNNGKNNRSKSVCKTVVTSITPIKNQIPVVSIGKWQKHPSENTSKYETKEQSEPEISQSHSTITPGNTSKVSTISTLGQSKGQKQLEKLKEQNSKNYQEADNEPVQQVQDSLSVTNPDKKLSKCQQHRKNIQNELTNLQKIKRPSKQQRQRMEKLQKQIYYLDSDIAGLKRKIRRKY